ncbi:MAG: hypothetical protein L3J59_04435 [Methylococcaceae bacterium]|nr:hypothetical protein [Methylococcaceae bacterium]
MNDCHFQLNCPALLTPRNIDSYNNTIIMIVFIFLKNTKYEINGMNKLIFLIAILFACGAILFLYFNEDSINLPSPIDEKEKQLSDKNRISQPTSIKPPPAPKTDKPISPNFSDNLSSSTTSEQKTIDIKKKTDSNSSENEKENINLDSTENEGESINSYPIEDAEIYFVPPDQRYPGNLGGPPPLDIPDTSR